MKRVLAVGILSLSLCWLCSCAVYTVNRAALVPHAQPTLRSGQPSTGIIDLSAGLGSVGDLGSPEADGDNNVALEIPAAQIASALRVRPTADFDFGLIYERGLDAGAHKVKADQPDVDSGDTSGMGFSAYFSIPLPDPQWRIGVALDAMLYSIPYVEYRTCIDNCGGESFTYVEEGRETVAVGSFGVVPSYKIGKAAVFAGLTVRNHPTIEQHGIEGSLELDEEVEDGPANFLVSAGVEYDLWDGLRGSLIVFQDVSADPARYKPSFSAMLTVPLMRERKHTDLGGGPPMAVPPPAPTPY